ncbi:MAG: T9SS C-terminal target domain-containing protein, partial [Calditrichaeota bacterium]
CWGLTDDINDLDRNAKFQAARDLIVKTSVQQKIAPNEFDLLPNYPNPFNPTTTLRFTLAAPAMVNLKIYNLQGQAVRTLIDELRPEGEFSQMWDGRNEAGHALPSAIYVCRMTANGFSETIKLSLIK